MFKAKAPCLFDWTPSMKQGEWLRDKHLNNALGLLDLDVGPLSEEHGYRSSYIVANDL